MTSNEFMMEREDVLPVVWKYYISIMAVSCYDCEYLLKILGEQFLLNGGDINWLINGIKSVDKKLQKLGELNELMAYKPWNLTSTHIEFLIKGDCTSINENNNEND
jgi:hypothetical protein